MSNDTITSETNGWPRGTIHWRYHPADQAAVFAQVIAAVTHLRLGENDAALKAFTDSGLPAWRHVPAALQILSTTIAARSSESVTGLTDQLLDEHSPFIPSTLSDPGHHRDVELTVMTAVKHWAAGDYERLTELARTSSLHAAWWAWGACVILARICEGERGAAWLLRVTQVVADGVERQGGAK
jgi:hypothetical protein